MSLSRTVLLGSIAAVIAIVASKYWLSSNCPTTNDISSKVIIITGASSGIGAELAVQYGALGAHIAITARRAQLLEKTADAARAAGAKSVLSVPTDMSDRVQVEAFVASVVKQHGRIDVLLLNHASVDDTMLLEYSNSSLVQNALETVVHSNLFGSVYATYAALPHLEAAGGHIAVISSASVFIPAPFHTAYVASKRALNGYYDTLRHELKLSGSRVTIGVQVLGMIGTPEIMKDPGNHALAMPVPLCAAEMICAAHARTATVYVPKWYEPLTWVLSALPHTLQQMLIEHFYVNNSADYMRRIKHLKQQ